MMMSDVTEVGDDTLAPLKRSQVHRCVDKNRAKRSPIKPKIYPRGDNVLISAKKHHALKTTSKYKILKKCER